MSSASKVGEILCEAGEAFCLLASLTARLAQTPGGSGSSSSPPSSADLNTGRWTAEEEKQLREAVASFGTDLTQLSRVIRSRSVNQIRHALKRRALDASADSAAGTSVKSTASASASAGDKDCPSTSSSAVVGRSSDALVQADDVTH